jgi:cytochrome d ubiquinol oxidase subunit II
MPIDYDTLRVIWWLLLAVLLIGFAVMDGFDLGVAALLPVLGRSDAERRVLLNAVGPVWEGNQIWFILGGGAVFAAWPPLYATAFSGFYLAMFLVLVALILRPVGFTFRSKLPDPRWRALWDWALCGGAAAATLVFGVAMGNVLVGVPFHFDARLLPIYEGSFFGLLNPFALLCGLASVAMLAMHGAGYLAVKTGPDLAERAHRVGARAALALIVLFLAAGAWVALGLKGYEITGGVVPNGPSNPVGKTVDVGPGLWWRGILACPWALAAPVAAVAAMVVAWAGHRAGRGPTAFVAGSAAVAMVVATPAVTAFPFLLPSSSHPDMSLTVWDASSSHFTLFLMLVATVVFLPIVLAYTAWVYRVLRGRLDTAAVASRDDLY